MRVAMLVLVGLLLQDADPALKLLGELQSDDIVARDEASEKLVKLGPPALPAVREALAKATGDLKARLESIVVRIGREELKAAALGPAPRISLQSEGKPLPELVERLRRELKLPIAPADLPADPVKFSYEGSNPWEALDALCKAHGGIRWSYSNRKVRLSKGPYRERPRVVTPHLAYFLDRLEMQATTHAGGASTTLQVSSWAFWNPGRPPRAVSVNVERIEDDQGNALVEWEYGPSEGSGTDLQDLPGWEADTWSRKHPAGGAARLAEFRGKLRATYVVTWKKIAILADPERKAPATVDENPYRIEFKACVRDGAVLHVTLAITRKGEGDVAIGADDVHLVDDRGRSVSGRSLSSIDFGQVEDEEPSSQVSLLLAFPLAEGARAAALEVRVPDDVEVLDVPFSFPGIPLK